MLCEDKGSFLMRINKPLTVIAIGVAGLLGIGQAWSATQSVTANIAFDTPLTLTKTSDINFGTVTAANASTYRISTAGAVSTVSGTGTQIYGTTSAGSITITGSASDTITISAGSYTANNGVTPSNATCSYKGAAATACLVTGAAPGSGTPLLLGVDVAADGTQAAGSTAAPTFVMSVTYN